MFDCNNLIAERSTLGELTQEEAGITDEELMLANGELCEDEGCPHSHINHVCV